MQRCMYFIHDPSVCHPHCCFELGVLVQHVYVGVYDPVVVMFLNVPSQEGVHVGSHAEDCGFSDESGGVVALEAFIIPPREPPTLSNSSLFLVAAL